MHSIRFCLTIATFFSIYYNLLWNLYLKVIEKNHLCIYSFYMFIRKMDWRSFKQSLVIWPSTYYIFNKYKHHTDYKKIPYQLIYYQNPRTSIQYCQSLRNTTMNQNVQVNDLIIGKINLNKANIIAETYKQKYPSVLSLSS